MGSPCSVKKLIFYEGHLTEYTAPSVNIAHIVYWKCKIKQFFVGDWTTCKKPLYLAKPVLVIICTEHHI